MSTTTSLPTTITLDFTAEEAAYTLQAIDSVIDTVDGDGGCTRDDGCPGTIIARTAATKIAEGTFELDLAEYQQVGKALQFADGTGTLAAILLGAEESSAFVKIADAEAALHARYDEAGEDYWAVGEAQWNAAAA